ncbi:mannitol dehydrogenase family protein, partial [Alphaproteobacteria bacterium]|nr:mannitol dehydrogenase family protein [Alphaproteobacteria bacterium]
MKLNQENIILINNLKSKPNYNPKKTKNSILHFGVGNFHRAHQAFFFHEMLNNNIGTSIIGINLRSDETRRNLEQQNNFYSLYECTDTNINIHVLNPYKRLLFGLEDKEEICKLIANKETKIITITVTEKGYHYNRISKSLDLSDDIQNDLEKKKIKTLVGHISYGLIQRFKENKEDIYIISCDNLSHNGDILKKVVTDFVSHIDKNIALWIEERVKFPCTMVDCIVPNTKKLPNEILQKFKDNSLVICEPYRDWYIENSSELLKKYLVHDRIKFVDNIEFYESIKLKILNASHSALAYLGLLLGHKYVHEAINDELCYNFINNYLDREVMPTIHNQDNFYLIQYKKNVLKRFRNHFLNHKLEQIGKDGSLKIPIRIIDTFKSKNQNIE